MDMVKTVYRISRTKFIRDLTGFGAKRYGGRWNHKGIPVLYTAENRSLAILELMVNFNSRDAFSLNYSMAKIKIPESHIIPISEEETRKMKSPEITQFYFFEKNALIIKVPSIIIPQEFNFLINPQHSLYAQVFIDDLEEFELDKRLKIL
jgi:RES domain-containing protein